MNFKRTLTFVLLSLTFLTKEIHYHYHYNSSSHKAASRKVFLKNLTRGKSLNGGLQFTDIPKIIKPSLEPLSWVFEEQTDPATGKVGTAIYTPGKRYILTRARRNPDGTPTASLLVTYRDINELWEIEHTATPHQIYIKALGKDEGFYLSHKDADLENEDRHSANDVILIKSRTSSQLWRTDIGYA